MQIGDTIAGYTLVKRDGTGFNDQRFIANDEDGNAYFLRFVERRVDSDGVNRLGREMRLLQDLEHPGIIPIVEWGLHHNGVWMCQEHCNGQRLNVVLAQAELTPRQAVAVARRVGRILVGIHGAGMVVRDLSPEHVLVAADGSVRLVDLGLAKAIEQENDGFETVQGQTVGNAAYLAPEYVGEGRVSPKIDVYGLGALLYQMLAGRPPFAGSAYNVLLDQMSKTPDAPSTLAGGIPPELDALVLALLDRNPQSRLSVEQAVGRLTEVGHALAG